MNRLCVFSMCIKHARVDAYINIEKEIIPRVGSIGLYATLGLKCFFDEYISWPYIIIKRKFSQYFFGVYFDVMKHFRYARWPVLSVF
jgi:hypothetical protein